jgi:hypothetical protein
MYLRTWSSPYSFFPHSQLLHLVFGPDYLSSPEGHKRPALNVSLIRSGFCSIAPSSLTWKSPTLPTHTHRDLPTLSICPTYPGDRSHPIRKGLRETVDFQQLVSHFILFPRFYT